MAVHGLHIALSGGGQRQLDAGLTLMSFAASKG